MQTVPKVRDGKSLRSPKSCRASCRKTRCPVPSLLCGPPPNKLTLATLRTRSRECCGISKRRVIGKPIKALVSTSYVEKHNQTMRQHMKRFTRLTNGHSKKIDNHVHMVALYTTWYNFARINSAVRMSPAMAARLTDNLWDIGDIVKLIEEWEVADVG